MAGSLEGASFYDDLDFDEVIKDRGEEWYENPASNPGEFDGFNRYMKRFREMCEDDNVDVPFYRTIVEMIDPDPEEQEELLMFTKIAAYLHSNPSEVYWTKRNEYGGLEVHTRIGKYVIYGPASYGSAIPINFMAYCSKMYILEPPPVGHDLAKYFDLLHPLITSTILRYKIPVNGTLVSMVADGQGTRKTEWKGNLVKAYRSEVVLNLEGEDNEEICWGDRVTVEGAPILPELSGVAKDVIAHHTGLSCPAIRVHGGHTVLKVDNSPAVMPEESEYRFKWEQNGCCGPLRTQYCGIDIMVGHSGLGEDREVFEVEKGDVILFQHGGESKEYVPLCLVVPMTMRFVVGKYALNYHVFHGLKVKTYKGKGKDHWAPPPPPSCPYHTPLYFSLPSYVEGYDPGDVIKLMVREYPAYLRVVRSVSDPLMTRERGIPIINDTSGAEKHVDWVRMKHGLMRGIRGERPVDYHRRGGDANIAIVPIGTDHIVDSWGQDSGKDPDAELHEPGTQSLCVSYRLWDAGTIGAEVGRIAMTPCGGRALLSIRCAVPRGKQYEVITERGNAIASRLGAVVSDGLWLGDYGPTTIISTSCLYYASQKIVNLPVWRPLLGGFSTWTIGDGLRQARALKRKNPYGFSGNVSHRYEHDYLLQLNLMLRNDPSLSDVARLEEVKERMFSLGWGRVSDKELARMVFGQGYRLHHGKWRKVG